MASENSSSPITLEQRETENIDKLKNHILRELYHIWSLIGIDEEQKLARSKILWDHLFDLGKDIVNEERGFYEDIKERIKNYDKKISDLSIELDIPKVETDDATLIEKEEILRQELDKLSKLKHKRIREYQDLHAKELKLSKLLGMPQLCLSSTTGVPSEKDLDELEQNISMLKKEREKRLKKFCMMKRELTTILEVTELTPETSVEKEILSSNECSSLSHDTLKVLEDLMAKTMSKKADLESEKKELMEKLSFLWDRLNIDKVEREIFLSRYNDCRVSNLNAIKQEIDRCEEVKRQNISQYIKSLREELLSIWEKCFVSETERQFLHFDGSDANEDILEAFDKEVAKWREYYKNAEHIILKIQKRDKLWDLLTVFENKAEDPNRFKNRRGNLLQEERERKKLQKDLPNLENEIFEDIAKYEEKHGTPFSYLGMDFREHVTKQWEDRTEQKENEKLMRQKMRTKQIESEITLGTTPLKKHFLPTPKSAPSKLFKSTLGVPVYRTPNFSTIKSKLPNTVSKFKIQNSQPSQICTAENAKLKTQKNQPSRNGAAECRNILKEKNSNAQVGTSKADSTTYAHFAASLNKSSRKVHRSSVLSSRKIVGTRTTNTSKRKSAAKSIRKSATSKKASTSKMVTPARGKLGMPFLI